MSPMSPLQQANLDEQEPDSDSMIPDPPRVPMTWPLERNEWREYQHAKLRQITATQVAVVQLRNTSSQERAALASSVQGLHAKVDTVHKSVESLRGDFAGMRESLGQIAEHFGQLAADLYGHSKDTRDKLDSMNDIDEAQDIRIATASIKANRARIDAERATLEAEKAGLEAAQARQEASSARTEAALAKASAAKSDAEAALATTHAEAATTKAEMARRMAAWKVATLLAAGPAVYAVFQAIYKMLH
jgi:chromosome segregation ATPase